MPPKDFEYWIDANLPPQLAQWLENRFSVKAFSLNQLGLLHARDNEIYTLASNKTVIIVTKDEDFADLIRTKGAPPKVIWITAGNISNQKLKNIILDNFETAVQKLEKESNLVEIALAN